MLRLLAGGFRALVGQAKRIITAGLRLTGNTTYHHLERKLRPLIIICSIFTTNYPIEKTLQSNGAKWSDPIDVG